MSSSIDRPMVRAGFAEVRLLPAAEADALPAPRLEVRQRRLGTAVVGVIAAAVTVAVCLAGLIAAEGDASLWLVVPAVLFVGGFSALFASVYLHHARSAGGPQGWVLREDGEHLVVNLRSHLNTHFDRETALVLVLPRQRVRSLRVIGEDGLRADVRNGGRIVEHRVRREYLDIEFSGDSEAVRAALAAEGTRRGKATLGTSRYNHSALRMLPDGLLRVAWRDESNRLRPSLPAVREALRFGYRFMDGASAEAAPIASLDRTGQESRLLDMAARGERLQAVALAKVLYGMDTTEAKRFIDELVA